MAIDAKVECVVTVPVFETGLLNNRQLNELLIATLFAGKPHFMLYINKHPFDFTAKITYPIHFIYLSHDFTITLLSGHSIIAKITECYITVLSTLHIVLYCILLLFS